MNKRVPTTATTHSRRGLLGGLGLLAGLGCTGNAAALLALTPVQTRGPFYPASLPLDSDNDLVHVAGHERTASGDVTDISGSVTDASGNPLAGVRVEIWQCDANGRYHHPRDTHARLDPDFQGYGQYLTGKDGGYRFRTIRPVPYPGRTPHVHFALSGAGAKPLVTQMYVHGEPLNRRDALFRSLGDSAERVLVRLRNASQPGARYEGTFNIVLASG